ncbi:tRNA(Met) cytidine acetate ligase [Exiguobacterium sp. TDN 0502]|uniref:tRNA(Met) cytidine acetate ligase n=1 Tax=Exiguobacterium sp. TDN 0502 TaxID=3420731 RepID=UPI003D78A74E
MRMTAIISEYNPFHNGHYYQATTARRETDADVIVAIMSGTFMQRGEPAFTDKWTRARAAVASGAIDLVLELPFYFAVQRADRFALGGVTIAETIGCQSLSFGSECGDITPFLRAAAEQIEETPAYKQALRDGLTAGLSSAHAASQAFKTVSHTLDLTQPNNTLGYYYARATTSLALHTTKRIGSGYHDLSTGDIMSATAIRAHHQRYGQLLALPAQTENVLTDASFANFSYYYPWIRQRLLSTPLPELIRIAGIDASLAPRLIDGAKQAATFDAFMDSVKTRRYTRTSLQRALVYLLTATTSEEVARIEYDHVDYVRPLAFNERGRSALKNIKNRIAVYSTFTSHPWLTKESQVTAAYALPLARHDALVEHRHFPYFAGSSSK